MEKLILNYFLNNFSKHFPDEVEDQITSFKMC